MTLHDYGTMVLHWLRNGPREEAGTVEYLIGWWFWWRIWAHMALLTLPLGVGLVSLNHVEPALAVMISAFTGILAGQKILEVTPKYNVTKQY